MIITDNLDRVYDLESIMDQCDPENPPRLCCYCPAEDMCCDGEDIMPNTPMVTGLSGPGWALETG